MLVVGGAFLVSRGQVCRDFQQGVVSVGDIHLTVNIASTAAEQQLGLAGCSSIPDQAGMYFPYQRPTETGFWMKGMLIPIDIVWIADGRVVAVDAHIPPPTDHKTELLTVYRPPHPVTAVLEVSAGRAVEYGIKVGSVVTVQ